MKPFLAIGVVLVLMSATAQAQDPPPALVASVQSYVETKGEVGRPMFRHAITDLNGDGIDDAIVLLLGSAWCGSGGCNMLVLRGTIEGFTTLSVSTVTNEPIRVSPEKVQGWRTLIVFSKGRGDVLMRFNGARYPLNPSTQPKATSAQVNAAQVVMQLFVPK